MVEERRAAPFAETAKGWNWSRAVRNGSAKLVVMVTSGPIGQGALPERPLGPALSRGIAGPVRDGGAARFAGGCRVTFFRGGLGFQQAINGHICDDLSADKIKRNKINVLYQFRDHRRKRLFFTASSRTRLF